MNDLERALTALGRELAVPDATDLVPAVLARIERQPTVRPRRRRRWMLAVALVVLAALAATLAIPDARSALFRVLHIGGERIELVDELPTVVVQADLELALGERSTLEQAQREAGFDLRQLDAAPDRVYVGDRGTVWFVYGAPDAVRLLVAQTRLVSVHEALILKKLAGPETSVEPVDVDGARGYFLAGAPHVVLLLDEFGTVIEESVRLAKNVLVWEANEIAYRLEGDFTRDDALSLAESLR